MTSTPGPSKGKGRAPTDWRLCALSTVPTVEQLSNLELPMDAMPEQQDTVPATYAINTTFLVSDSAVPQNNRRGQATTSNSLEPASL